MQAGRVNDGVRCGTRFKSRVRGGGRSSGFHTACFSPVFAVLLLHMISLHHPQGLGGRKKKGKSELWWEEGGEATWKQVEGSCEGFLALPLALLGQVLASRVLLECKECNRPGGGCCLREQKIHMKPILQVEPVSLHFFVPSNSFHS